MKHLHRIHILTALLIPIVSIGTASMLLGDLLTAATEVRLADTLKRARDSARQSATLDAMNEESERVYTEGKKRLQELGRAKRAKRLEMAGVLLSLRTLGNRRDQLLHSQEVTLQNYDHGKSDFAAFLRFAHVRQLNAGAGPAIGGGVLRRLLGNSLGDNVDADLRDDAVARAREQILERLLIAHESDTLSREQLHGAAGPLGGELFKMRKDHDALRTQYNKVLRTLDSAERTMRASAAQFEQLQRDTAQVQADILSMQGELDRIDGRLRAKAERELVQKGLMKDRPDRFRQNTRIGKGQFFWPVTGPVSAGFHDARYEKFFSMPHDGIDIVVPFGTPVAASSDGIVFIVRLGGATGYTYVLIGHRGGYATVYGHLSDVVVKTGDTVSAGQVIGVSGGTPGTEGAGKMTTGAHLHFEVLLRGERVDPETVLP